MSGSRGILAAGLIAVVVTSTHAAYRYWPVAYGTEICVPAALYGQPADVAIVGVGLPLARLELNVPHVPPAVTERFEPVRTVGDWWVTTRRGRPVYVQLTAGPPVTPAGPAVMRPVTVSDTIVDGAVNLAGTVNRVREDGYIWLDFPFGLIAVPRDVAARARPPVPPGSRSAEASPIPPASDPGVFAVLRVLPSGRAALVGLIVNGTRY